jgi:hypothetical protein
MPNPTKTDDSLARAAQEIRRRMLRDEKLKRIEEAEMARLKAGGWRPSGPIALGRGGPTLHDAAQGIESIEEQKEALAREAKRRVAQRARERTADQGHVGRHAVDRADRTELNKELDRIQGDFVALEKYFRDHNAVRAADMFKRYLDGVGGKETIDADEFRAYPKIQAAAAGLIQHYMDWMTKTPTSVPNGPERISQELGNMNDGETKLYASSWDRKIPSSMSGMGWDVLKAKVTGDVGADVDLYGFIGEAMLRGDGKFKFTRRGKLIDFDGIVAHHYDEPFNFEMGRDFPNPAKGIHAPFDQIMGSEGELLQKYGRAKPFDMHSQWVENVTGTLFFDSNGMLHVLDNPRRTTVDPRWARTIGPMHRGPWNLTTDHQP